MADLNKFINLFERFPEHSQMHHFLSLLRRDNVSFPNHRCFDHLQNPERCSLYLERWLKVQLGELSRTDLMLHKELEELLTYKPERLKEVFSSWFPVARVKHLSKSVFCHTKISTLDVLYFFVGDANLKWPLEDYLIAANGPGLLRYWNLEGRFSVDQIQQLWRIGLNNYNHARVIEVPVDDETDLDSNFQWELQHLLNTRGRHGVGKISGPEIRVARKLLSALDYVFERSEKRQRDFSGPGDRGLASLENCIHKVTDLLFQEMEKEKKDRGLEVHAHDFQETQDYFVAVNSLDYLARMGGEDGNILSVRTLVSFLVYFRKNEDAGAQRAANEIHSKDSISTLFLSHTLNYAHKLLKSRNWRHSSVLNDYNRLTEKIVREQMGFLRENYEKLPDDQLNLFYEKKAFSAALGLKKSYDGKWRELHSSFPMIFFGRESLFSFDDAQPEELNRISVIRSFQLIFFLEFVKHYWMLFYQSMAWSRLFGCEMIQSATNESYLNQMKSESFGATVNEFEQNIFSKSSRKDCVRVSLDEVKSVLPKLYQARKASFRVLSRTFREAVDEITEGVLAEGAES